MLKDLQDIGLSEKESRVYLAALKMGHATADQLAKHAHVVRPTTYVQLEALMKKGLISTYEEGKKTYFAPQSPELLTRLLAKQKDELELRMNNLSSILPDLLDQFEALSSLRLSTRGLQGNTENSKALRDAYDALCEGNAEFAKEILEKIVMHDMEPHEEKDIDLSPHIVSEVKVHQMDHPPRNIMPNL